MTSQSELRRLASAERELQHFIKQQKFAPFPILGGKYYVPLAIYRRYDLQEMISKPK